jgi:hypothetical protein
MYRIHQLNYGEIDGYYTRDQVVETIGYLQDDKVGSAEKLFKDHLHRIVSKMNKYDMQIILAREVIAYDEFCDLMVGTYHIHPTAFRSFNRDAYTEHEISAPNFHEAESCINCAFFDDQTDQDETTWGYCSLHTETNKDYDPPLKTPFELSGNGVCDSFAPRS